MSHPPRHEDVHAADAILVVGHAVHQLRDEPLHAEPGRIGQILADVAAGIAEALGKLVRLRIEQDARRLAGARGQHDDARLDVVLAAGVLVDVGDAGRAAGLVDRDLAGHGVVDDRQLLGRHRRRNQHRRRGKIRVLRAASAALAAVVARHPSVQRLRQNRQPAGNARDLQLVGGLLDEQLVAARLGRRQEDTVGIVRQPLLAAENADERVDPVVERLHVLVGDRPVVAETIKALPAEVIGAEPERDPSPVIRAPAEHAGPEPVELAARAVGIGLAFERPPAERRVELPELLLLGRRPAARRIVRPLEHVRLARGIPHRPGLEHDDVGPSFGEHLGGHPAAGAGADDADIVERAAADDLHGEILGVRD